MKILITNDDGISSPILPAFVNKIRQIADITVVVPQTEQSGKSQAIDFHNEVEIKRVELFDDVECYAMASTPADCVRFGVTGLNAQYDLVISGINCGYNLGDDIVYSGTVGAIFEAARLGIRGLALSAEPYALDSAVEALDPLFAFIQERQLFVHGDLFNVNIPPQINGISITKQGGMYFTDRFEYRGNDRYIQVGSPVPQQTDDTDIDIDAIRHNLISITPMNKSRTDFATFDRLKGV